MLFVYIPILLQGAALVEAAAKVFFNKNCKQTFVLPPKIGVKYRKFGLYPENSAFIRINDDL